MNSSPEMTGDKLELRYIAIDQAQRWDQNPKKHDIAALIRSIEIHGFGDPPKYDTKLQGLVYGNGRTEALERMRADGKKPPRGIASLEDGTWAMPVLFGIDASSKSAAIAFGLDNNNLTLGGGNLGFNDLLAIWDEEGLQGVLEGVPDAKELLVSFTGQEIDALLQGPDFGPVAASEQSRLDEKKSVTCPECGHEFAP